MRYIDAGVDIEKMNLVKSSIVRLVRTTYSPEVLTDIGLFGALVRLPKSIGLLIAASCDGVGTKVLVAKMMNRYDTIGIDIVNHCVNDILTLGARPLFFLDYIAHTNLPSESIVEIVKGLARACRYNNCSLVGGETAMMPDLYRSGDFDLVGFIVGLVEKKRIIDPRRLKPGDLAIGIPSSGLHTNGYALARKVFFELHKYPVDATLPGLNGTIGEVLLKPHRSYFKLVYPLLSNINAIAHITGGGFYDNIKRLLPLETACIIKKATWRPQPIFNHIQKLGGIPDEEMFRTFNMGIGLVIFVESRKVKVVIKKIPGAKIIGKIVRGNFGVEII